jgi:kynurenine 3-monooxygenase
MNASFEDVRIFDEIHTKHQGDWTKVFTTFQDSRVMNTDAIADLAIDNFYEMQDKVDDIPFIKKRTLEMQLEQNYKDYYSKYSLVTFQPNLPYQDAMLRGRAQDKMLLDLVTENETEDLVLDEVYHKLKSISVG